MFWTSEQLSVIQAIHIQYLLLDAFYGTGKSVILQYFATYWSLQNKVVHYLVHRPVREFGDSAKLPFTLVLEHEFEKKNIKVHVKETTFRFGIDKLNTFLKDNGIEKDHFVCFDEVNKLEPMQ